MLLHMRSSSAKEAMEDAETLLYPIQGSSSESFVRARFLSPKHIESAGLDKKFLCLLSLANVVVLKALRDTVHT
jgi:hypothetical protein